MHENFLLLTPGIRSEEANKDDQKRISTANSAVNKGANFIVIGREITSHNDPKGKIKQILETV